MITIALTGAGVGSAAAIPKSFTYIRVDYSPEASVTEHPVELGAEISDHVQIRSLRFTVEVMVTASPTGVPAPFAIENAVSFLESAIGQLCTVTIPGEGVFLNCILEAFPHSKTVLESRSFALRFRQVRIAASLSVAIPPRMPAPVAAAGAPDEVASGQQATTAVPTSVAQGLVDMGRTLLGFGPAPAP